MGNFSLFDLIDLVGYPQAKQVKGMGFTQAMANTLWASIPGFAAAKLESNIFNFWQESLNTDRLKAKNSSQGLIYGRRLGERFATEIPDPFDNSWHRIQNGMTRSFFSKDLRRMGSAFHPNCHRKYNEY